MIRHYDESIGQHVRTQLRGPQPFLSEDVASRRKEHLALHDGAEERPPAMYTDGYEIGAGRIVMVFESYGFTLRETERIERGTVGLGHPLIRSLAVR
jgi:hypothetical protein